MESMHPSPSTTADIFSGMWEAEGNGTLALDRGIVVISAEDISMAQCELFVILMT